MIHILVNFSWQKLSVFIIKTTLSPLLQSKFKWRRNSVFVLSRLFLPKLCHYLHIYFNLPNKISLIRSFLLFSLLSQVHVDFCDSASEKWTVCSFYFGQSVQCSWSVHEVMLAPQCACILYYGALLSSPSCLSKLHQHVGSASISFMFLNATPFPKKLRKVK